MSSLDDQFRQLLHKKIMHKRADAKRQAKRYYQAQYRKTGIIPKPLLLAGRGIMEGRKCSGRPRVLEPAVVARFIEMVKASTDKNDQRFIFITQKGRKIKNYHHWLEEEFQCTLSRSALNRCAHRENLYRYLKQEDDEASITPTYFNPVPVFDLIQMDGSVFHYVKIKNEQGQWQPPNVIEFYDTGSRHLFVLDVYFSENSENSVRQFSQLLLSTPFPDQKIRIRPDNAKGFLNLKRPIRELNQHYSVAPDRFFLDADYTGVRAPRHKAHLESSHRTLHNFEIQIIKYFETSITKTEPGILFTNGKRSKITITYLNINIDMLRQSGLLERYRREHNETNHSFSNAGITQRWIPEQKLKDFLAAANTFEFEPQVIQALMKYGYDKKKASVSKQGTITYDKQKYVVTERDKFSRHQSTKVKISYYQNRIYIFEPQEDGVFLGEATPLGPSETPEHVRNKAEKRVKANAIDHIIAFLEDKGMHVNRLKLAEYYHRGLTLACVGRIYQKHQTRYAHYLKKVMLPKEKVGIALFNAFLIDCEQYHQSAVAPYASPKDNRHE